MSFKNKVDSIINENVLFLLQNLNKEVKNDDKLKVNINNLIYYYKSLEIKPKEKYESNIHDRLNKIDEYIYKKSWNKLSKEQKKVKIVEFMNSFFIHKLDNVEDIKIKILKDLSNNKLNSVNNVLYDSFSYKIIKIKNLQYNKSMHIYTYNT